MGPATGWGMGPCAGFGQARRANWGAGHPLYGRAGRRAWEGPGGHGWRHWYHATGLPGWARWPAVEEATADSPSREQEIEALKDEAGWLKDQLDAIVRRMDELSQE